MLKFKCTYTEINKDRNSENFGFLVERVKKFPTFDEAVSFSRLISNTTINMVGRPLIEEVDR